MEQNKKKLIFVLLLILLGGLLFFAFTFIGKNENVWKNPSITQTKTIDTLEHNGVKIEELLSEDNYEKVGINPNDYKTFKDFLIEFQSFTGVSFNPLKENFSIGQEIASGQILYTPFRFYDNAANFDDKINKNLAILDIYSAYKNGMTFGWRNSSSGKKIIFEDEYRHPESSELAKIFASEVNVFDYIKSLENSKNIWESKQELLTYLYDFTWDYSKSRMSKLTLCKDYQICKKEITFILSWVIKDANGKWISWVKVESLNSSQYQTKTKLDGSYTLEMKVFPFSHLRFKASKLGYSDAFGTYGFNEYFTTQKEKRVSIDFKLQKAEKIVDVNKWNLASMKKWRYFIIEHGKSKYFVPIDGLYFKDGKKYEDFDFQAYLYFFTKESNMENLLWNDTFEPVLWYVGNIMKTFWMPYIQFIDKKTKQEIFVKSSNPMILQNTIHHMKELYENHDKIYEALSKEDMKLLVAESEKSEGYPIDFNFLTTHKMLRWPAWWALDRETWIWTNIGHRVINEDWLVELPFYSVKD